MSNKLVSEFASVALALFRFTLTKDAGMPVNYVLSLLVLIEMIKKTYHFHDYVIIHKNIKRHHPSTTMLSFIRIKKDITLSRLCYHL